MFCHPLSLHQVYDPNPMSAIYFLKGVVKNYDWGGNSFLPQLLGVDNTAKKPFAEYWMGTHPQGMSSLVDGNGANRPLSEEGVALSFLLKVLDVKEMLSIQVHPTQEAAIREFALENEAGIAIDAPYRNYKDQNHKPELMVALGPFWLLHGFKHPELIRDVLANTPEFIPLISVWEKGGNQELYKFVMEMSQEQVDAILCPLMLRLKQEAEQTPFEKNNPAFWALRAAHLYSKGGHMDRGIFSIYFFNLVSLNKGEAIFQDAGIPHAYLEGQNVEIMANSDNVLRGGLTGKHIDVAALLKLGQLFLRKNKSYQINGEGPIIFLLLQGSVELVVGTSSITLKQGKLSAYWEGKGVLHLQSKEDTVLYLASSAIHSSE
jgi:mannose-6-phosphate isomerase